MLRLSTDRSGSFRLNIICTTVNYRELTLLNAGSASLFSGYVKAILRLYERLYESTPDL